MAAITICSDFGILRTDFLLDGLVGSPYSPRDSQESSPATQFKSINASALSFLHSPTLASIHAYWKKTYFWLDRPLSAKWHLCFLICCLSCHGLSSKQQASFNFIAAVKSFTMIWETKRRKSATGFTFSPSLCHGVIGLNAKILVSLECWVLSQLFHPPLSPSSGGSLIPLHFPWLEWYDLHIWGCWYFSWQSWFQLGIHPA